MKHSPQDYGKVLKTQATMLRQASDFETKTSDNPERDRYCRLVLLRTADLVDSCSLFVEDVHVVAGQILMRSMLEDLIKVLWSTINEANAAQLSAQGTDQLKIMLKANLQNGTARMVDNEGNNVTENFLNDRGLTTNNKYKKTIETMANEAGVLALYNMFYRFASLETHGNSLEKLSPYTPEDVSALLSALGAIAKATGHVSIRWLLNRDKPTNKELNDLIWVQ